jgi:hypothetical protein
MTRQASLLAAVCLAFLSPGLLCAATLTNITVAPTAVQLEGAHRTHSLLVQGQAADGRLIDLTHKAHYQSDDPRVARVTPAGVVQPVADGQTTVHAEVEGKTLPVEVRSSAGSAATRRAATARPRARMGSSSRCSASIRRRTTPP